jgi:hypothetical protein
MSKTFDEYCYKRQINSVQPCDPDLTLCALCELEWYKQRCEELEKQIERMKNSENCKINAGCDCRRLIMANKCPCKAWEVRDE